MEMYKGSAALASISRRLSESASSRPTFAVNYVSPADTKEAFDIRVQWEEFYKVVYAAEDRRLDMVEEKDRQAWHPATLKYAMVKDLEAEGRLEDYMLGDTARPGQETYDGEAYTDDEESDEDDSVDGDERGPKNPQGGEEDEERADSDKSKIDEEDDQDETEEDEEEEEEEENSVEDEDSDTETPRSLASDSVTGTLETPTIDPSTAQLSESSIDPSDPDVLPPPPDNDNDNEDGSGTHATTDDDDDDSDSVERLSDASDVGTVASHDLIKNRMPEEFNPELRSPIFFGYHLMTVVDVNREGKEASESKASVEADTVKRKIEEKKEELAAFIERSAVLKESRQKKLERLKKRHASEKVQRSGEYIAISKTMPPDQYAQLKRQFDTDEQAATNAAEQEVQEMIDHNDKMDNESLTKRRSMEQGLRESIENESNVYPAGAKLEKTARVDMKECVTQLDSASDELDDAQNALEAMQEQLTANESDPSLRSEMIIAETTVEEAERQVERLLRKLEEQELLLQRALRRKAKENLILPLYSPLASSIEESDFSVGLLNIIVALAVVCRDKVTEKLQFLVELFDINKDEFLASEELKALTSASVKVLDAVGYCDRVIDDDEIYSIVLRAFYQMSTDCNKGMTHYETRQW